jgi:SAM-dependent methyltransferase
MPPWLRHQVGTRYEWASRQVGGRVLDAACGNGYGSEVLLAAGARVVAADIAIEALAEGRSLGRDRIGLTCASLLALPFPAETFDVVVSLETIEHVDDDRAYVAEVRRVLRPAGVLICSTPNRRVLNPGRALTDRPFNPFHVREYAADELESLLCAAFSSVTLYGQSPYASGYVSVLNRIGSQWPMLAVRLHQLRKVIGIPTERRSRHVPRQLPFSSGEPEALIAVCEKEGASPSI